MMYSNQYGNKCQFNKNTVTVMGLIVLDGEEIFQTVEVSYDDFEKVDSAFLLVTYLKDIQEQERLKKAV